MDFLFPSMPLLLTENFIYFFFINSLGLKHSIMFLSQIQEVIKIFLVFTVLQSHCEVYCLVHLNILLISISFILCVFCCAEPQALCKVKR